MTHPNGGGFPAVCVTSLRLQLLLFSSAVLAAVISPLVSAGHLHSLGEPVFDVDCEEGTELPRPLRNPSSAQRAQRPHQQCRGLVPSCLIEQRPLRFPRRRRRNGVSLNSFNGDEKAPAARFQRRSRLCLGSTLPPLVKRTAKTEWVSLDASSAVIVPSVESRANAAIVQFEGCGRAGAPSTAPPVAKDGEFPDRPLAVFQPS